MLLDFKPKKRTRMQKETSQSLQSTLNHHDSKQLSRRRLSEEKESKGSNFLQQDDNEEIEAKPLVVKKQGPIQKDIFFNSQ